MSQRVSHFDATINLEVHFCHQQIIEAGGYSYLLVWKGPTPECRRMHDHQRQRRTNGDHLLDRGNFDLCPNRFPWNVAPAESLRRRRIGRLVHRIWTAGGAEEAGLAVPCLDGRLDLLGLYQTFLFDEDDDDDEMELQLAENGAYSEDDGATEREGCRTFRRVDRIHRNELSYGRFINAYMRPNRPLVVAGLIDEWPACREWTRVIEDNVGPNLPHLSYLFGKECVHVYEQTRVGFGASRPIKSETTIAEYAQWWEDHRNPGSNVYHCLRYLKDWKFQFADPTNNAYQCPSLFQDDWLNRATGNKYAFCYIGPQGTSTVLHADVLLSYSWSANVCGRKKWFLVPPELSFLLYDCFGMSLATHLHSDLEDGVGYRFPGLKVARKHAFMVVQEARETIFVPSQWFHTVENLTACLSINHNW